MRQEAVGEPSRGGADVERHPALRLQPEVCQGRFEFFAPTADVAGGDLDPHPRIAFHQGPGLGDGLTVHQNRAGQNIPLGFPTAPDERTPPAGPDRAVPSPRCFASWIPNSGHDRARRSSTSAAGQSGASSSTNSCSRARPSESFVKTSIRRSDVAELTVTGLHPAARPLRRSPASPPGSVHRPRCVPRLSRGTEDTPRNSGRLASRPAAFGLPETSCLPETS